MDQLEREVREMLKDRANGMPAEYEPSTELLGKASRRRTTKMVAFGVAVFVVAAGVVGVLARDASQKKVDVTHPPTSLPAPAGTVAHPKLKTVECPMSLASGNTSPFGAPVLTPRATTTGDASLLSGMTSFAASRDDTFVVAAPKGWSCQATLGEDGAAGMDIYLAGTTPTGGPIHGNGPIHVAYDWLWHGAVGAGTACEVFQSQALLEYWQRAYPGQPCKPPVGRTVTGDDKLSTFTDRDGTVGVGIMRLPTAQGVDNGQVEILSCRPSAGLSAAACQSIVADYASRNQDFAKPQTQTITADGRIGSLQISVSKQSDVTGEFGAPDASAAGSFGVSSYPGFQALGYDCTTSASAKRDPLVLYSTGPTPQGPYCKTIFYINDRTKTLGAFSTTSSAFATEKGTSVGSTESAAARNEGQNSSAGCDTGISLGQPRTIFINVGTKPTDHVNRITAELPANAVGALFC
jgi:hypothetical protein